MIWGNQVQWGFFVVFNRQFFIFFSESQNQFGKALSHTNEAIKNIGAGTIEAASGAFNFFKDAASAVIKSG